jgi:L-arabinose isomerase
MFTTDYQKNRILISHMGESNIAMAKNKQSIRLVNKNLDLIKSGLATSIFIFPLKPGNVTLFNLTPTAEGFMFSVGKGAVQDMPLSKGLNSPHAFVKVNGQVEDFLNRYSSLGGTHHLAMAYGDFTSQIKMLGQIMDIPVSEF